MPKYETGILQCMIELAEFKALLAAENVRSYLEIGSKHGGSLWHVGTSLPEGSRIVSIDLPHGDTSFKESEPNLRQCVDDLCRAGYDAALILGDSTDPAVVRGAAQYGPYDCVFIDANHTEPYVRKDWENYGPMGRIVAFHDIGYKLGNRVPSKKFPIEVPRVWAEIKQGYRHRDIILHHTGQDNGIGVLWRDEPVKEAAA